MSNFVDIVFLLFMMFVAGPVCAFMVIKFGTAGFYRARQRERKRQEDSNIKNKPV